MYVYELRITKCVLDCKEIQKDKIAQYLENKQIKNADTHDFVI